MGERIWVVHPRKFYDFLLETPQLEKLQGLAANLRHERQGGGENGVKIPFSLNSTHAILIK